MRALRATVGVSWFSLMPLLASCSGRDDGASALPEDFDQPPLSTGGTRLRQVRWAGEGVDVFGDWHDSGLDLPCVNHLLAGDRMVCLPADLQRGAGYYADEGCTREVAVLRPPVCSLPTHLARNQPDTCPPRPRIFRASRSLDPAATIYFNRTTGICRPIGFAPRPRFVVEFGEEVPLETFVVGRLREEKRATRLAPVWYESDDGARRLWAFQDAASRTPCELRRASDGSVRCLPRSDGFSWSSLFSDLTCTMPAGLSPAACFPLTQVRRPLAGACPSRSAVHRAGARLEMATLRGADCSASRFSLSGEPAAPFALGEEVPPSTFADGSHELSPGSGRLRTSGYRSALGVQREAVLHDTRWTTDCTAELAADGLPRCLPTNRARLGETVWADPACTVPVAFRDPFVLCEPTFAEQLDDTACPVRHRIFRVVGPHQGDVYVSADGACTAGSSVDSQAYYDLSPEIPPTEFVAMTRSLR